MHPALTLSPIVREESPSTAASVTYQCGNLVYTKRGLIILFIWLLWGDFCFTFMEAVVPSILPLKLRSLGSANWLIGAIMSTLPGIFNTTICPWVSFKSDRYRSQWGRRIPFILFTMPFLTLSLILIGLSDDCGAWVHQVFFTGSKITKAGVTITLLVIFAACFDLFNMFVNSVFWWLFNDVIPRQFLVRFMAYFRLVGIITSAGFNFFVFKYAESYMREIYLAAALLYFLGFSLVCFKVKEREYPPLPDTGLKPSLRRDIKNFINESYSIPYYWNIFLNNICLAVAGCMGTFMLFFQMSLNLDLDLIGKLAAVNGVMQAICLTFVGGLVDKRHPVRVMAYLAPFGIIFAFNSCVWLFAEAPPEKVYFGFAAGSAIFFSLLYSIQGAATVPREMMLFPQDRFGQFCGAQVLVRSAGSMAGGIIAGSYIDLFAVFLPEGNLAYRSLFLWQMFFLMLGFGFHYRAYRVWKKLGAEVSYTPPVAAFNVTVLLKEPAKLDSPNGGKVYLDMAMVGILGITGLVLFDLTLAIYFSFVAHQNHNAVVFGFQTVIILGLIPLYLRLLRFMERP